MAQGAEARLYSGTYDAAPAIRKVRMAKPWRHVQLDGILRKSRTKHEVSCLKRAAEHGLTVPSVLHHDREAHAIILSYVPHPKLRDVIRALERADPKIPAILAAIGRTVAALHDADMIHEDLTTSNMLYDIHGDTLTLIDFGLGRVTTSAEDKAVDLYVLERALDASHPRLEGAMDGILAAYKGASGKAAQTLARLEDVRRRGRKRSMLG